MPSIKEMVRVQFYSTTAPGRVFDPYDCSKQSGGSPASGNSTKYCLQSRFYTCAMRVHCPIPEQGGECPVDDMAKVAAFLPCAEAPGPSGMSTFESALPCAKKHGLNVEKIQACYNPADVSYTGPAVATIDLIGNATNAASVQFFPDVRVAETRLIGTTPTVASLVKAVCAAYKGPNRSPACSSVEQA